MNLEKCGNTEQEVQFGKAEGSTMGVPNMNTTKSVKSSKEKYYDSGLNSGTIIGVDKSNTERKQSKFISIRHNVSSVCK
jgi:hypothetical protein